MTGPKVLWLLAQFMEGLALIGACLIIFTVAVVLILKIENRRK